MDHPPDEIGHAVYEDTLPDVYFIVLDSYMRADAMAQDLGFDNSSFVEELRSLGFYVAECSRPNYPYTLGSLASALNMDYLPSLRAKYREIPSTAFWSIVKHSEVRRRLENMGYKTIAFRTSYAWSEWEDADVFLGLDRPVLEWQAVTPFESLYLNTTAFRVLADWLYKSQVSPYFEIGEAPGLSGDFSYHVSLQRFILDRLPEVPRIDGPKLVFVHILIPHPPYVFAPDGSILTDPGFYGGELADAVNDEYRRQGYIYGVEYINSRMIPILERIIHRSSVPPIVVLQGDHGFRDDNRFTILNAYYLPGGHDGLYSTITPVNSFRVIFNQYFGGRYPLMPDTSYNDQGEMVPETYFSCLP